MQLVAFCLWPCDAYAYYWFPMIYSFEKIALFGRYLEYCTKATILKYLPLLIPRSRATWKIIQNLEASKLPRIFKRYSIRNRFEHDINSMSISNSSDGLSLIGFQPSRLQIPPRVYRVHRNSSHNRRGAYSSPKVNREHRTMALNPLPWGRVFNGDSSMFIFSQFYVVYCDRRQ